MENAKKAVKNAVNLYLQTFGMTLQEFQKHFAESEQCRENIYMLVALQANHLPFGKKVMEEKAAA